MSESILNALVHLFALNASLNAEGLSVKGKQIVQAYLTRILNEQLTQEYLDLFQNYIEFYHAELHSSVSDIPEGNVNLVTFQATNVCRQIKNELDREERIIVFIQLLQFVNEDGIVTDDEAEVIRVVSEQFSIGKTEGQNLQNFVFDLDLDKIETSRLLTMDNKLREWADTVSWFMKKKPGAKQEQNYAFKENLYGQLLFLHITSVQQFVFKYIGEQNLYIEGQKIESSRIYFLNSGSIIRGPNITPVYYKDIAIRFFRDAGSPSILYSGKDLQFKFRNSQNGIHSFNFCEESGSLIGILGGSGVGKSTLLHLLNGKLRPNNGQILINGFDLYKYRFNLKGMIGFVPQDDLLIEELTVYQNLYFNARLCFADYSTEQIKGTVGKILEDLDLTEIAWLRVGSPLNKFISGGQRKRLNIGLELMREPYIMILDEPTSGLSSSDSENIIQLLRDQTRKGRLVIATIHQPSSKIFKMLDKLWILDKGGYPVYSGNPIDAIVYFKKINAQVDAAESECPQCGNVNTEQILKIIESKTLDEQGTPTRNRRITPRQWFDFYKDKIESRLERKKPQKNIPENNFKIPGPNKQFITFSLRNLLTKISNTQYLIINLLEAPLLALILGYFTKYTNGQNYIFQDNKNFPIFLFMSIVVALFMGLTVSAEEIVRDRKILERESFLNLSWPAYLGSKIIFLIILSAIQAFSFVLISSWILDIRGMLLIFWMVLFSTSVAGNLIGLNISSGLDSVVAIYILIPLILVPQLLLGGAMISFDDLNQNLTNKKNVPVIGDMMITRWSYEALVVEQFMKNDFDKHFYEYDQQISTANYYNSFLIPDLQLKLERCQRTFEEETIDSLVLENNLLIARNEFNKLTKFQNVPPFELVDQLTPDSIQQDILEETLGYLMFLKLHLTDIETETISIKDQVYSSMVDSLGEEKMRELRQRFHNNRLAEIAMNRNEIHKIYQAKDELIRKFEPIYIYPENRRGRAQFFAPYKLIINQMVETAWFNLVVIWLGSIFLYFLLVFDILRKILLYFQNIRMARSS